MCSMPETTTFDHGAPEKTEALSSSEGTKPHLFFPAIISFFADPWRRSCCEPAANGLFTWDDKTFFGRARLALLASLPASAAFALLSSSFAY